MKTVFPEIEMLDLMTAIRIVEISAGVAVVMLLGDYLGYKLGRLKLAAIAGIICLLCVVALIVYTRFVMSRQ